MMINPGPNDSSTVFALLTAIASPEAAKASLQEITDASTAYQKLIDNFRAESTKTSVELSLREKEVEDKLATAVSINDNFDKKYDKQSKELQAASSALDAKKFAMDVFEGNQNKREETLLAKENNLSAREGVISSREQTADQLMSKATDMVAEYEKKLSELKAITG